MWRTVYLVANHLAGQTEQPGNARGCRGRRVGVGVVDQAKTVIEVVFEAPHTTAENPFLQSAFAESSLVQIAIFWLAAIGHVQHIRICEKILLRADIDKAADAAVVDAIRGAGGQIDRAVVAAAGKRARGGNDVGGDKPGR